MEEALLARMRAEPVIAATAGTFNNRPAIDWAERMSNEASAFPACVLTIVSPGRFYDQDGADGLQRRRVRCECFGLDYGSAKRLARAVISGLEQPATVGNVRFHRGQLDFERDFEPEDLGSGIRVYRTLLDLFLPTTQA